MREVEDQVLHVSEHSCSMLTKTKLFIGAPQYNYCTSCLLTYRVVFFVCFNVVVMELFSHKHFSKVVGKLVESSVLIREGEGRGGGGLAMAIRMSAA